MSGATSLAFVLLRRPFREHDLQVTLLREDGCRMEAFAPSGQRSRHRYGAGLSTLVLYRIGWSPGRSGPRLDDAAPVRAWPGLLANLRRQTAAQCATAVARGLAEPIATDAALFTLLHDAYDHLDAAIPAGPPEALLARFVLEALDVTGHAPCFDRCARCDTPAPDTAAVTVEPAAGGVVCRGCGGGRYRLAAPDRADLRALLAGDARRGTVVSLQVAAALLGPVAPDAAEGLVKALDLFRAPPPDAVSG